MGLENTVVFLTDIFTLNYLASIVTSTKILGLKFRLYITGIFQKQSSAEAKLFCVDSIVVTNA
jgi:hypothetical protein